MPVQFLSGGGGGGTSDVRSTFAAPVLTTCSYVGSSGGSQVMAKWTIPANYFVNTDTLLLETFIKRLAGGSTQGTTCRAIVDIRLGTTGTISDTLLATTSPIIPSGTYTPETGSHIRAFIGVKTIGSGGTCIANLIGKSYFGGIGTSGFTNGGTKTIDTTSTLYLTICVSVSIGSSSYYVSLSPVGSSLIVGF